MGGNNSDGAAVGSGMSEPTDEWRTNTLGDPVFYRDDVYRGQVKVLFGMWTMANGSQGFEKDGECAKITVRARADVEDMRGAL